MSIVRFCHSSGVARFACAQAGCQDCLAELLQENRGLVYQVIQYEGGMGMELTDLKQEGRIGLWQAIRWYDPSRGTAFSSLARVLIRYRIWNTSRSADSQWEEEAGAWLELVDELEEEWWLKQMRQALLEAVERLPMRLRKLIVVHYGLDGKGGRSLAEIGREWGISRERVRQLRNNALVLLRLPALSQPLRSLCEQDSRAAYHRALALNRAWQRSQRRRP